MRKRGGCVQTLANLLREELHVLANGPNLENAARSPKRTKQERDCFLVFARLRHQLFRRKLATEDFLLIFLTSFLRK